MRRSGMAEAQTVEQVSRDGRVEDDSSPLEHAVATEVVWNMISAAGASETTNLSILKFGRGGPPSDEGLDYTRTVILRQLPASLPHTIPIQLIYLSRQLWEP
eukprot:84260-Pyramimonas_sp.AAC.1